MAKLEAIGHTLMKDDGDRFSNEPNTSYDWGRNLLEKVRPIKEALNKAERSGGTAS